MFDALQENMMKIGNIVSIVVACVTFACAVPSKGVSQTVLVVRVRINSPPPEYKEHRIRLSGTRTAAVDLDLGEEIDGQPVWLSGDAPLDEYRVLERFRTSLAVMGEGFHMDLVAWKHHDSVWRGMRQTNRNHFVVGAISEREARLFPKVSKREMAHVVETQARRGWAEAATLVRQCASPNTYPCSVGVSSRYFRVQRQKEGVWITVGTIEIRIPMGC
jgi:hypothetical protein